LRRSGAADLAGWWWFSCARAGAHVGEESWVEREVLVAWDAGSGVAAAGGQRMVLWLQACRSLTPSIRS